MGQYCCWNIWAWIVSATKNLLWKIQDEKSIRAIKHNLLQSHKKCCQYLPDFTKIEVFVDIFESVDLDKIWYIIYHLKQAEVPASELQLFSSGHYNIY